MFVRADVSKTKDSVHTVCHELAHRLQHKFLSGKQGDIEALYEAIKAGRTVVSPSDLPKVGRDVTVNGKEWTVNKVAPRSKKITLYEKGKGTLFGARMEVSLDWWMVNVEKASDYVGFVSGYAEKGGPDENFAEMVAFYAEGKLPAPLTRMLLGIIG